MNAARFKRRLQLMHMTNMLARPRLEPRQSGLTEPLMATNRERLGNREIGVKPSPNTPRLYDRPTRRMVAFHGLFNGLENPETTTLATYGLKADKPQIGFGRKTHSALTIPSTIFLASANSIMVLSRKKSSFSTPA